MTRPRHFVLTFVLLTAFALSGGLAARLAGAQSSPVTAQSVQRWSVANGNYVLAMLADGTLVATGGDSPVMLNPQTGESLGPAPAPDVRAAVWVGDAGRPDYLIGGYQDRRAYRSDGGLAWEWSLLGCCNTFRYPVAIDHERGLAYTTANWTLSAVRLADGVDVRHVNSGDFFGFTSIAGPGVAYVAGIGGHVARVNADAGATEWVMPVDPGHQLQSGAVAADGSFVVSSRGSHLAQAIEPGRLARLLPDGTTVWNLPVNAVTPPVVGAGGLIYVGTQPPPASDAGAGSVEARDSNTGALVWSTPVEGLPNDLLLGDDGAVYVGAGGASARVYALDQATGEVRRTVTDMPGAWELLLSGGLLYVTGNAITALPVGATNYDPASPWPVRLHDNQRTANRGAAHINLPRWPAPDPVPTPPFTITVDPGAYAGVYYVNHGPVPGTGPTTLSLNPGTYNVRVGEYNTPGTNFFFTVDAAGRVTDVSKPAAAHGAGPALVFHNSTVSVDPQGYAGRYRIYTQPSASHTGARSFVLVPGLLYLLDNGYGTPGGSFAFELNEAGEAVNLNKPGVGTASGHTVTLNNATVRVDPQGYAGLYRLLGSFDGTFTGTTQHTLIPGLYYLVDNNYGVPAGSFQFKVDDCGRVTDVSRPGAADGIGNTLRLRNALVTIDPRGFAGVYRLPSFNAGFTGVRQLVLIPALGYFFDNGAGKGGSYFNFRVDSCGRVAEIAQSLSLTPHAVADGARLVLNNTTVRVEPSGYAGAYNVGGYAGLVGAADVVLVSGLKTFVNVGGSWAYFTPEEAEVAPSLVSLVMGVQTADFALSAAAYSPGQGTPYQACPLDDARGVDNSCGNDSAPPTTAATLSSPPNGAGWHNSDVTVTLGASDEVGGTGVSEIVYGASGAQPIAQTSAAGASVSLTFAAEGLTTLTYFARDSAGNVEEARTLTVRLDKTAPGLTADAQTDAGAYTGGTWTNRDVTISFGCMDAGSGVASVTAPLTLGSEGAGQSASGTCSDAAGNDAALTFGGINIDRTPPSIDITRPADGAAYTLGQLVTAAYACSDGGSGVAACAGPVAGGPNLDTSAVGAKTFTVAARDAAGNESAQTSAYSVGYAFAALFDQAKEHKSGSTLPVKLRLTDAAGRNLSSPALVVRAMGVRLVPTGAPGVLEEAGQSNPDFNFRYDASLGGYVFNLKTTGYATGTYALTFTAGADPTPRACSSRCGSDVKIINRGGREARL
ncbi:MAG TPA: PQQ-binding-like beta-propeller repeat protein [Pyrinomonadaceae bacterium]|nr:PQQ-binding-like beta-propeller repeat protein [Pyrinomonadaceae bacterium]